MLTPATLIQRPRYNPDRPQSSKLGGKRAGRNAHVKRLRRERVTVLLDEDGEIEVEGLMEGRRAMSRHQLYSGKSLSDNLGPLSRYLDKQVGKQWDSVYSYLCAVHDRRGPVSGHAHDHIEDLVEVNPVWINDKPHRYTHSGVEPLCRRLSYDYSQKYTKVIPGAVVDFYVDRDGVLCRSPLHKGIPRPRTEKPPKVRKNVFIVLNAEGLPYRALYKPQEYRKVQCSMVAFPSRFGVWGSLKGEALYYTVAIHLDRSKEARNSGFILPEVDKHLYLASLQAASKQDLAAVRRKQRK